MRIGRSWTERHLGLLGLYPCYANDATKTTTFGAVICGNAGDVMLRMKRALGEVNRSGHENAGSSTSVEEE
jgi:hypothetical protein